MKSLKAKTTEKSSTNLKQAFFSKDSNNTSLFNPKSQINNKTPFFNSQSNQIQKKDSEPFTQIWNVGPIDALRAKRDATTALQAAKDSGLPGLWNGPADAFRHAYWNCLMVRSIGIEQAKEVADTHESIGSNHVNEQKMDFHNNHKGRMAGQAKGDSSQLVMNMLTNGKLLIIPNYEIVQKTKGKTPPDAPISSNTKVDAKKDDQYTYGGSGYGGYNK